MASIKITDLDAYTNPDTTDVLAIVDVGADQTKKISIADLMENAGSGTESAPGIAFDGDPNTGIYRPGADQLAISTAGTQRLLVSATGAVTIPGNLTVQGTTTFIDSETLQVEDKNIEIGKVASPTDTTADGGGITLKGATDKTLNWVNSTDSWTSSENVDLASGKTYKINGTDVLSGSSLGSGVTGSSLTSVGTITSGTWNGTPIATASIADDAVTADKLANTAVTAGSYTAADITVDAQGRITAAASGTLGTAEIADLAVTTAKIADDAVTADKLANTAVTAGSYTAADITVDAQGRITAAASGSVPSPDSIAEGNSSVEVTDTGSNGTITFTTEGSPRATIDSSGTLLVGATTNNYSNVKFLVAGANSSNYMAVLNTTASDANESRYSFLHFRGTQSGGEESSLVSIAAMHDGSADDQKGLLSFRTNAGSDNNAPTERMRISANGDVNVDSGTFYVDAVNNRVGVGTASPARPLHVVGDIVRFDNPSGAPALLLLDRTSGSEEGFRFVVDVDGTGSLSIEDMGTAVSGGGTERLRIDSSGRLGLGESTPEGLLEIRGASTVGTKTGHIILSGDSATNGEGPQIVFSESGSGASYAGAYIGHTRTGSNSVGNLVFGVRTTVGDANTVPEEAMRIDEQKRVGIGATTITDKVHIIQSASTTVGGVRITDNATESLRAGVVDSYVSGIWASGALALGSGSNTFSEKARIDSSGRLGVGTSAPGNFNSNANQFVVNSSASTGITVATGNTSNGHIFFADGITGDQAYRGIIKYEHSNDAMWFGTAGGTERLRLNNSGAFGVNGANYGTSGQVLTSQGSGSAPQWATPSAGVQQSTNAVNLSGAAQQWTGIPSTCYEIRIAYQNVSWTTANSGIMFRLGDSGGLEASGYYYTNGYFGSSHTGSWVNNDSGFKDYIYLGNTRTVSGSFYALRSNDNIWIMHFEHVDDADQQQVHSTGYKSLSGTLDRIELRSANNYNFDSGNARITYIY